MNLMAAVQTVDWGTYITQADMKAILDTFLGILPVVLPTVLALMGVRIALGFFKSAVH